MEIDKYLGQVESVKILCKIGRTGEKQTNTFVPQFFVSTNGLISPLKDILFIYVTHRYSIEIDFGV